MGGKSGCQSACTDPEVEPTKRCAGSLLEHFDPISAEISKTVASGGHVMVHCHASISRSAALIIAYLVKAHAKSVAQAVLYMKRAWAATWPCDRFVFELIAYEAQLKHKTSTEQLQATLRHAQLAV